MFNKYKPYVSIAVLVILILLVIYTPSIVSFCLSGIYISNSNKTLNYDAEGTVLRHRFKLFNFTTKTKYIINSTTSCTCTIAKVSDFDIKSFKCIYIDVAIDKSRLTERGRHRESVSVMWLNGKKTTMFVDVIKR